MKKRILLLFLLITPLLGTASHIVGGEFELIHLKDFQYRLNMVLYFDEINGNQGAKDNFVTVTIFRKFDNSKIIDVTLPFIATTNVEYTQPSCSHGELITSRRFYSAVITLSPDVFKDTGGYYVAWDRCCRNYTISNVFSDNPTPGAAWAGQTFYLEFPPVIKDGEPFIDSTPRLFPPLNDFGCPRRPYYTDFGGIDDDGDSLVYSLVTPLNTKTNAANPPAPPGPYPEVTWRPPFSLTNILNGAPDLRISHDGFLTVTPTTQGLFVFAVKVEEYRDKAKIGETRRDFQMLVVDACPRAVPPKILGKKLTDASYGANDKIPLNVSFLSNVPDNQRCIKVQVSDPDSESPDDNFIEHVRIKAFPLNFKKDLSGILPVETSATLINGSTVEFDICFPACPYFLGGDAQIGIIAMDDACSLPLTDTLKINVFIEPPVNTKPYFTTPNPVTATLQEGTSSAWPFAVKDNDNDPLIISVLTNGFVLANAGVEFQTFHQTDGAADGQLKWDAFCNIYDFTKRTSFQVTVMVEDQDKCLLPNPVKSIFNLSVILPSSGIPSIDSDLTTVPDERSVIGLTRRINESLKFRVTGTATNNDFILLRGAGKDFSFSQYAVKDDPLPVAGNALVTSDFQWDIRCTTTDLKKKDLFDFQFILVDSVNKCHIYKTDTLDVEVKILPPLNRPPLLTVVDKNTAATVSNNSTIIMVLGTPITLSLTGTDADVFPDKDQIKIELTKWLGTVPPVGYTFKSVTGQSPVETTFAWTPDCSIFEDGVYENDYVFTFNIHDDHCLTAKKDSINVKIKIKDVDGSDTQFIPPNFFSPNGDIVNDYFAMELKDAVTGEIKNILPNDNCLSQFEGVRIYNRWGNQVFQSDDRNFKWLAPGESAGVYYYFISYTKKEYRGSLSLRY